jgi:hypothetical protein
MKALRAKDLAGKHVPGWTFGTFKGVNVILGQKPRATTGWQITSPDGCERYSEGNYQQFVPFANMILSNYGCQPNIS